jgi:hypothetical protein
MMPLLNRPLNLLPQQYMEPLERIPQAVSPSVSTCIYELPESTAAGEVRSNLEPSPTWPDPLDPQQYNLSFVMTPQVLQFPTFTVLNVAAPIVVGVVL